MPEKPSQLKTENPLSNTIMKVYHEL